MKKLKNYQVLDLTEAFSRISQLKFESTKKFSYAVVLNDETLKPRIKALLEVSKPSEKYAEYESKRNSIIQKYAKTDSDGTIILRENKWVVFSDGMAETASTEVNTLNEEYSDVLAQRDNDIEQYNTILNEEVELSIVSVSLDDIPDIIGQDMFLMRLLIPMIE